MTDPLTLQAEDGAPFLAVDLQPGTGGRGDFVLDRSVLDGPDRLGYPGTGWVNYVCDVLGVNLRRGATRLAGPLTRTEVGTATVTVLDTQRRLDPLVNGDAVHKGTPLRLRAWGYAPVLSPVEARRNLATDPRGTALAASFQNRWGADGTATATYGTSPWGAGGWPFARRTVTAAVGAGGRGFDHHGNTDLTTIGTGSRTVPVTAGQPYTLSVYVRSSVALPMLTRLAFYDAAGARVGSTTNGANVTPAANTWTRLAVTATAPAGAAYVVGQTAYASGNLAVGDTLDATALLIEQATTAGAYFDGTTSPTAATVEGGTWTGWTGAADASPSVQWQLTAQTTRWDAVLFTGQVDDLGVSYSPTDPPTVTLSALDLVGRMAAWGSAGYPDPGVGAGDNLRARVLRVLAEMGLPASLVSADSDSAYLATLAPTALSGGWSDVTAAQDAELGRVWVNSAGQLVTRSRWSQLSGTTRGTLSDVHGEAPAGVHCCIADADVVYGSELLTNRAVASRRVPNTGGTTVPAAVAQVEDEYSQARYGLHAYPSSGGAATTELQTDDQLAPWGQALVFQATEPSLRVDRVVPDPGPASLDNAGLTWQAVCLTDVGDRWLYRMHPAAGPAISRALGVLGLEWAITPDAWTVTWHTADAPTPGASSSGWFALDVSSLDTGDLLAPFGGIPA